MPGIDKRFKALHLSKAIDTPFSDLELYLTLQRFEIEKLFNSGFQICNQISLLGRLIKPLFRPELSTYLFSPLTTTFINYVNFLLKINSFIRYTYLFLLNDLYFHKLSRFVLPFSKIPCQATRTWTTEQWRPGARLRAPTLLSLTGLRRDLNPDHINGQR